MNFECAEEFAEAQGEESGLVCRECGTPIEFDLWQGNLGPLCQRCYEKFDLTEPQSRVEPPARRKFRVYGSRRRKTFGLVPRERK